VEAQPARSELLGTALKQAAARPGSALRAKQAAQSPAQVRSEVLRVQLAAAWAPPVVRLLRTRWIPLRCVWAASPAWTVMPS
jgi:hypothetical protein